MNHPNRPYRRNRLFIQRAFQGRFIGAVLAVIFLFGFSFGGLLYLLLRSILNSGLQSAHLQVETLWQQLEMAILLGTVVTVVVAGLAAAVLVLLYSHKIAGPLYRITRVLEALIQGDLEVSARLRAGDQLQELAAVLQNLIDHLRDRRDRRLALVEAIERCWGENMPEEVRRQLEALRHLVG